MIIKTIVLILLKAILLLWPILFYLAYSYDQTVKAIIFFVTLIVVKSFLDKQNSNIKLSFFYAFTIFLLGLLSLFLKEHNLMLYYPVFVNAYLLYLFSISLFSKMPMIERFARYKEKYLDKDAILYTRLLTKIWIGFFIVNGSIAFYTAIKEDIDLWFLYNGFLSYIAIGTLFIGEILVRPFIIRKNKKMFFKYYFTQLFNKDRNKEDIVIFDKDKEYIVAHVQILIEIYYKYIKDLKEPKVAIVFHDMLHFTAAFFAILMAKKIPVLCPQVNLNKLQDTAILDKVFTFKEDAVVDDSILSLIDNISLDNKIYLYTSGSTGEPKCIEKTVDLMQKESLLFLNTINNRYVDALYSSVSPIHLYGLTFYFFTALCANIKVNNHPIEIPEQLELFKKDAIFVTSPTFINQLDFNLKPPKLSLVLSAGGKLDIESVKKLYQFVNIGVQEIYGSTETGIMATRYVTTEDLLWQPFKGISFIQNEDSIKIQSPLIIGEYELEDKLLFTDENHFKILGRKDRIVKIGDKRFSLNTIENIIKNHSCVKDVAVITLKHKNVERTAALVILNDLSLVSSKENRLQLIKELKTNLLANIDRLALPRWWRFADKMPVNEMGKKQKHVIEGFFDDVA